ncbi:MAG: D-glycerate dehydrogenase [Deltaproteobacteria bacterium]|nr:D-glycerate dehydrogenase [Deltaproteobacteria bacterium]
MKILVTIKLSRDDMNPLEREHSVESNTDEKPVEREYLAQKIKDKNGILCAINDRIDRDMLKTAPDLKMIANYGVGYDNIDLDAATEQGIMVSNTPGVLTDSTADIAFALILATARRVVEGDHITREGRFGFWTPFSFLGREVTGKRLGIIGMGRIGTALAKRAKGFDMRILYHNRRRIETPTEKELGAEYAELDALLAESDFISLHVPLTAETRHLIGKRELSLMKKEAYLINTSRGSVIDEHALFMALKDGIIAGAGLDVYEKEPVLTPGLSKLDNAVILPHIGSATIETRKKMARMAVENLLSGLRDERPPNCINWEELNKSSS